MGSVHIPGEHAGPSPVESEAGVNHAVRILQELDAEEPDGRVLDLDFKLLRLGRNTPGFMGCGLLRHGGVECGDVDVARGDAHFARSRLADVVQDQARLAGIAQRDLRPGARLARLHPNG